MDRGCSTREMRNTYTIFEGKPEGKTRPLGRLRRRWDGNIGMGPRESVDLIQLTKDWDQWRVLVNTLMNLCVP